MALHRRLAVRVLVPIVLFTLLLGAVTVSLVVHAASRFIREQADTSLRLRTHTVWQIANTHLDQLTAIAAEPGPTALRAQKTLALLGIEDFARTNGVQAIVFDTASQHRIALGDLQIAAPVMATATDAVTRFDHGGKPYLAYAMSFEPWRWRLTLIQSAGDYEDLRREIVRDAAAAATILAVVVLVFLLYLAAIMRRPIEGIVGDVRADRPPRYRGIAEFEFLAEAIAAMMAANREHAAAVARYRDHLEELVDQRTVALTRANDELEAANRALADSHCRLLQSEKLAAVGQLAAGIAHEINNPIGFVSSNLSTLKCYLDHLLEVIETYERHAGALAPEASAAREIDAARRAADLDYLKQDAGALLDESNDGLDRVKRIVQDLREFSHPDGGEWVLADLHRGIDSTLNIVWNQLRYKAEVVKTFGALPEIECQPGPLNQVFMNLLVNAGQAIAERGEITIRTASADGEVVVEVADTGCGLAPEVLPHIFDPFFTTKPIGVGTGLGLSIAYGIVRKHHGSIEVDSTPGVGTTFRIRLPVRQAHEAAGRPAQEAHESWA